MQVQDLGQLTGPVIVFGGPYSNIHAFDALRAEAARRDVPDTNLISTGDLVAYCADAKAVVAGARAMNLPVVAGNCEKQLGAGGTDCGCGFEEGSTCSQLAVGWYAHADRVLDADDRAWLLARPDRVVFTHREKRYGVIHGGAERINDFLWPDTQDAVLHREIAHLEAQIGAVDGVIAGHSGISFIRKLDRHVWINAGTIGMPEHDGRAEVRFLNLDAEPRIDVLTYDADAASAAMTKTGLTQGYHEALTSGWWPSEDILPQSLRRGATA